MAQATVQRPGRVEGKVCIVTGAGSPQGIGWATIIRFADEGARHIYALDIDDREFSSLKKIFEETYTTTKITFIQADASEEGPIKGACEQAVHENGRLDIFFANAGILGRYDADYAEDNINDFMRVLRVNAGSAFVALRYAPEQMAKTDGASGKLTGSGSIILTASVAGLRGGLGPMPYSASKAAAVNMMQCAAAEFIRKGISVRVNAICPGGTRTGMSLSNLPQIVGRNDLFTEPRTIANAVLYLASDESNFVNAEHIAVDNGMTGTVRFDKLLA